MMDLELLFTFYSQESPRGDENYYANIIRDNTRPLNGKPCILWFGDCDNDVDGSPYWKDDPCGQNETSLHYQGKALNGDVVPFIVVPPGIIQAVPDVVMGCQGAIYYKGRDCPVVVGDLGPRRKIGEASPAALRAVGLPALHNGNGGLDEQAMLFRIWPGVPARLILGDGTYQFELQHA